MTASVIYQNVLMNLNISRNKLKRMTESSKPHVMEDIRKYQQMLDSIDSRRTDGIFGGSLQSGNVPAGQAVCSEVKFGLESYLEFHGMK